MRSLIRRPYEARDVRDPLADELQARGWNVECEFLLSEQRRVDIFAERRQERRLIECKVRNPFAGVTQVLGYRWRYDADAIPTLAVPRVLATAELDGVCRLAGVDLWVKGEVWAVSQADLESSGRLEIRRRFENLAAIIDDRFDQSLIQSARDKWEELVAAFRCMWGNDPFPQFGIGSDGSARIQFPKGWGRW